MMRLFSLPLDMDTRAKSVHAQGMRALDEANLISRSSDSPFYKSALPVRGALRVFK